MAAYPPNFPFPGDGEAPRTEYVYVNPYHPDYYDPQQTPERLDYATDRSEQYEGDLSPDLDPYDTDDYSHHNHHHHGHNIHGLPPLTIRRHAPGSNDPSLQRFPANLQPSLQGFPTNFQPSSSDNIPTSSNVNVTIKRNPVPPIPPEQTVIQPILYPVAVYVQSAVPQYPIEQPIQPIQPIQPPQAVTKPPSPKKPISPIKISPTPPISPTRYETELFPPPSSRDRSLNSTPRRPVRIDLVTPSPPTLKPQRIRSGKMIVEEFDDYDEQYRVPTVYSVPRKVISYRTVPGMTTRELENDEVVDSREDIYFESPPVETVTYRTS
jgi:hypothetical protein